MSERLTDERVKEIAGESYLHDRATAGEAVALAREVLALRAKLAEAVAVAEGLVEEVLGQTLVATRAKDLRMAEMASLYAARLAALTGEVPRPTIEVSSDPALHVGPPLPSVDLSMAPTPEAGPHACYGPASTGRCVVCGRSLHGDDA